MQSIILYLYSHLAMCAGHMAQTDGNKQGCLIFLEERQWKMEIIKVCHILQHTMT